MRIVPTIIIVEAARGAETSLHRRCNAVSTPLQRSCSDIAGGIFRLSLPMKHGLGCFHRGREFAAARRCAWKSRLVSLDLVDYRYRLHRNFSESVNEVLRDLAAFLFALLMQIRDE